jgi:broad specificity phosphatase PhoE
MSDPAPMNVYFIRHGETAWSLSGQHTGRTDLPLTPHGEGQAHGLVGVLHDIVFTAVLTSPSVRARRTCALAGLERKAVVEQDLSEWNYGDYEGLTSAEIRITRPGWNAYQDGCPGGETPSAISGRADRLIARLRGLAGNVALFSHGQFGSVLAARWIGLPASEGQHFPLGPASLSRLGSNPSHPEISVIAFWNFAQTGMVG